MVLAAIERFVLGRVGCRGLVFHYVGATFWVWWDLFDVCWRTHSTLQCRLANVWPWSEALLSLSFVMTRGNEVKGIRNYIVVVDFFKILFALKLEFFLVSRHFCTILINLVGLLFISDEWAMSRASPTSLVLIEERSSSLNHATFFYSLSCLGSFWLVKSSQYNFHRFYFVLDRHRMRLVLPLFHLCFKWNSL